MMQLMKLVGTKLAMSTANHPQTDGQSERANRTLEDMLRAYIGPHHDDWDKHLTAAEFAYNEAVQASTGYSPFYLDHGQDPITPLALAMPSGSDTRVKTQSWQKFVDGLAGDLERAKENLKDAQDRQRIYANKGRRNHTFNVGDKVMISHKFISSLPSGLTVAGVKSKFLPRNWGPFEVTQVINDVAIRLKLPTSWKIHPVIHSSYLTPYHDGQQYYPDRQLPPPDPEEIEGELHYSIEAFVNHKVARGKRYFLVKWEGYSNEHNEWRPITALQQDMTPESYKECVEAYRAQRNLPSNFWKQ